MLRFRQEHLPMPTIAKPVHATRTLLFAALASAAWLAAGSAGQSGYGYGAQSGQVGYGSGQSGGSNPAGTVNGMPPGVGYNNPGGELSRQALQQAALAPEYHLHMAGPTAADAVGSGGGPAVADGPQPGYVQAKFVTPYGNATVMHHYGPGYPPPIGMAGPNDGNAASLVANGTVAGNPGMVNWGLTPAWTREEIGNGAWFGGASGVASGNPVPYVGSFND
jgi:hypothetical protein